MNKTENVFRRAFRLLNEQDPASGSENLQGVEGAPQDSAGGGQQMAPTPGPAAPEIKELDENEKYIIKILTNAFIFNPNLFDKSKQNYIYNKVEQIGRMVNVPVAKMVDEIKKIIALDKSLMIESKTQRLLRKYFTILEQNEVKDATEPQTDSAKPSQGGGAPQTPSQNGNNSLNLAEIFPLYKELVMKALKHAPTEEELMIIKPVVNEFADADPEKIVGVIQNILTQSLEDQEVEDNLSNA